MARQRPEQYVFRVAGLTHRPGYPHTVLRLADQIDAAQVDEIAHGITRELPAALLKRDPENPADPNAIEVHIPTLGRRGFVGFVPGDLASGLAPIIDSDVTIDAHVSEVVIHPKHIDRPGLEIVAVITRNEDPHG